MLGNSQKLPSFREKKRKRKRKAHSVAFTDNLPWFLCNIFFSPCIRPKTTYFLHCIALKFQLLLTSHLSHSQLQVICWDSFSQLCRYHSLTQSHQILVVLFFGNHDSHRYSPSKATSMLLGLSTIETNFFLSLTACYDPNEFYFLPSKTRILFYRILISFHGKAWQIKQEIITSVWPYDSTVLSWHTFIWVQTEPGTFLI